MPTRTLLAAVALGGLLGTLLPPPLAAGPLGEQLRERVAQHRATSNPDTTPRPVPLPAGVVAQRDVAYGPHVRQRYDVYVPVQARRAPMIVLVHGGGWTRGDKAMRSVVENKVARWVPRGFIVISTNYRLVPDAPPLEQAMDVARALAHAQVHASRWGGDGARVVLMGHSAGAHLVSLLTADPTLATGAGARPWLGTVALDSGAFDVPRTMQAPHAPLYDEAFGAEPAAWRAASPIHRLRRGGPPLLAVCSTQRRAACPQARAYAAQATRVRVRVEVLPQPLSHRAINDSLGEPGHYTAAVEFFLRTLDPTLARLLAR